LANNVSIDSTNAKAPGMFWLSIASRMLLGGLFAFCAGTYLTAATASLHDVDFEHPTLGLVANIVSIFAMTTFLALVAYLYARQLPALTKFAGWRPAAAAGLGSFAMLGLLLLEPRTDLSPDARLLSAGLIMGGNIFAVCSLHYLNRSFSILPQARLLVLRGPYHFIRHPLYLAEAISIVGVLINFLSMLALALFCMQLICQFLRMNYEENVLRAAFPEYEAYRRRTARLLPGVY
jgi:protein-S-isoprenylcysteine O-methyltransferase Ste14